MKKKFLSFLLLASMACSGFAFTSCGGKTNDGDSSSTETPLEMIDYAAQVKLDMNSETIKQEVTVENFIDGDTTHFKVPTSIVERGILKARYLACNTPESTGKIEEWGKKASNYTKTQLKAATSIIIETDSNKWEVDSTGERYLVWVWYKTAEMTDYSCLNIELLQQGLAVGSKASESRYGEVCVNAIDQATQLKLHVHSTDKDPDFFYGEAIPVDLKELRFNLADYTGKRVVFEGIVSQYDSQGAYLQQWNEEAQAYYGIYVYYGFFLSPEGEELITEGNRMRIVGNVQYWETGDSYQVSDLRYNAFKPNDPDGIQLLDTEKHEIPYVETTPEDFNKKIEITVTETNDDGEEEEVIKEVPYAQIALNTTINMKNLQVTSVYTTDNGGDNDGAITITCKVGDQTVTVRTAKLYDENKELVTEDFFRNKTIDVNGIIDYFNGEYQIKVFALEDINIH
ncbi:MAG: thermonuclease family protein [Clostridia bacterium]|nr:thermonuclease family protein [Clostridia bacterium]